MNPIVLKPLAITEDRDEAKTFKQETEEYLSAINQFLEEHGDGIDIPHQYQLEQIQTTLEEIVGYLF